jgi:hypothetical protein
LDVEDQAHFETLARNRFHAYLLGMQHAEDSASNTLSSAGQLLVNGMVVELQANPGLLERWHQYNFAGSKFGKPVTRQLVPGGLINKLVRKLQPYLFQRS